MMITNRCSNFVEICNYSFCFLLFKSFFNSNDNLFTK